jgi:glutamate dehydrogenase/leucine dehydrogenase
MTITAHPASALLDQQDHERVVIRQDRDSGLRFIVAVHSTALGPALGGMRLRRYPGGLREALDDVLALARTMSLKASAAGLDLGGGKAVMLADSRDDQRELRLTQAAGVIDELGGAYITAEDIGTSTADMDLMARHTRFVVGRSRELGGRGDPSPVTAETVFRAVRCGVAAACGSPDLDGRAVGVIGLGKVGYALAAKLAGAGAHVVACDLEAERTERFAAEHGGRIAPSAEAVLGMELDVLSPCAAGGMIDTALAGSIDCRVVAGAANNPLTGREVADALQRRSILYVPDFLANCGGLIRVAGEWYGEDEAATRARVDRAAERLELALATAAAEGSTPMEVAERQALERIDAAHREVTAAA